MTEPREQERANKQKEGSGPAQADLMREALERIEFLTSRSEQSFVFRVNEIAREALAAADRAREPDLTREDQRWAASLALGALPKRVEASSVTGRFRARLAAFLASGDEPDA